MTDEVEAEIRGLAQVARPTERQVRDLLEGWQRWFEFALVPPRAQLREFRSVMDARAARGQLSLVAPVSPTPTRRVPWATG